tara:strand:- start:6 stop:530 length:525 start_codon:yes stop_codon:yes gene_type:complete
MSILKVDTINEKTSGNGVAIPGHVVQTVSFTKTDTFSTTSTSYTDITNLSLNITPLNANSKILVRANLMIGGTNYNSYIRFVRDSTAIGVATGTGNRPVASISSYGYTSNTWETNHVAIENLDSPNTTSALTYKVQIFVQTSGTAYINRSNRDTNESTRDGRGTSTLTLMEIAQ